MALNFRNASETQKRRVLHRRMLVINGALFIIVLIIASRLVELQLVNGREYATLAQSQHYGQIELPAKRGEILGVSSKTGEKTIFATNVTLDLVYVDPSVTSDPASAAETLSQILLTPEYHDNCSHGKETCPRELVRYYSAAFDPLLLSKLRQSGSLLEPIPLNEDLPSSVLKLPNLVQARDEFAADIRKRIEEQSVVFAPLKYGTTKLEMQAVEELDIPGITVDRGQNLVYANPQDINQSLIDSFSRKLGTALKLDPKTVASLLRTRPLRYVPIMRQLPLALSRKLLEAKSASAKAALEENKKNAKKGQADLKYPLQGVALISEHWRYYPDTTIASHVIGFVNVNQEAQYGVERIFNAQLRGQKGSIRAVSDPHGGQILRPEQHIQDPKDGDTIILTLDRAVQKEVETVLNAATERYRAESAQVIVMDPFTGRIIAMANTPLFDSNNYTTVYEKEPITIDPEHRKTIVVEIYDPETNALVVRSYKDDVFTASGRTILTPKTRKALSDLEKLYDLKDLTRYYLYVGDSIRREIFPTDKPDVWLKFKNNLGLGAYLNRSVQEIYEPGSVMKPLIMAIALDQGELTPTDTYDDTGTVEVDQYKIDNNDHLHYGRVTMTNCLEFSINTCMTSVSFKLGAKLLYGMLNRFGFGHITGIELEDELAGEMHPLRDWSRTLLATTSFGQGISATPLQVITAWAALANGGKLIRPTIVDSVIHNDGTVEKTDTRVIDQVLKPETSETITAMLVSSATKGFAKAGRPDHYRIAGKTGTSQIAKGNGYETGTGSTFATYAGYAPVNHPKFLILVKIDRPKNAVHGATAAAPVFKEIAAFLFKYYDIPPDR